MALKRETSLLALLVYGDTNSTLAGALAAAKMHLPVAHVEAGLRSYQRAMPEEINRLLTDHLSTILFCPTSQAVRNLAKEGIKDGKEKVVKKVGDVMYDSILYYSKIAEKTSTILKNLGLLMVKTPNSKFTTYNYYLATLHRAENTDEPKRLKSILKALKEIGRDIPVVLPLHPRTKKMINTHHLLGETKGIKLIDPVSYFDMLKLEKNAKAILTDSGGCSERSLLVQSPLFYIKGRDRMGGNDSKWTVCIGRCRMEKNCGRNQASNGKKARFNGFKDIWRREGK